MKFRSAADSDVRRRAGGQALAIEQGQGAAGTQAAQLHRRDAKGFDRLARILIHGNLRHCATASSIRVAPVKPSCLEVDLRYRAGRHQIRLLDARSGNDDLSEFTRRGGVSCASNGNAMADAPRPIAARTASVNVFLRAF